MKITDTPNSTADVLCKAKDYALAFARSCRAEATTQAKQEAAMAYLALEAAVNRSHHPTVPDTEIGRCPHGYVLCFYCWRDAGFPGAAER